VSGPEKDPLTPGELRTLAEGIVSLGTIDARMAVLTLTLSAYPESGEVATGLYKTLLHDAADLVIAWQALRMTPFGDLFHPDVTGT
jgi:hypothetical protein